TALPGPDSGAGRVVHLGRNSRRMGAREKAGRNRVFMSDLERSALAPGVTFGHYRIVELLGRGGMGDVFLAHDMQLERHIAVKVLSAELVSHAEWFDRFQREARSLAALNHPNIVTVYSVEEVHGQHLLMMERVEG